MASFNQVVLMGNLTRDPQTKVLPSQTTVAEFGVAVNRPFTKDNEKREEVTFVDVTAFGKQAELIGKHFAKGKPIFLVGRLKYDAWEDKQSGAKRSKLTVVLDNFQFVGSRDGGQEDDGTHAGRDEPAPAFPRSTGSGGGRVGQRPQRQAAENPIGDDKVFDVADIPFRAVQPDRQPV